MLPAPEDYSAAAYQGEPSAQLPKAQNSLISFYEGKVAAEALSSLEGGGGRPCS